MTGHERWVYSSLKSSSYLLQFPLPIQNLMISRDISHLRPVFDYNDSNVQVSSDKLPDIVNWNLWFSSQRAHHSRPSLTHNFALAFWLGRVFQTVIIRFEIIIHAGVGPREGKSSCEEKLWVKHQVQSFHTWFTNKANIFHSDCMHDWLIHMRLRSTEQVWPKLASKELILCCLWLNLCFKIYG